MDLLAASETANVAELVARIAATGFVGLILLAILFRKLLMPTWVHDEIVKTKDAQITRLEAENEELKDTNQSMRTLTEQQIIPALVRSNQLSADYAQDLVAERRRGRGE